MTGFTCDLCGRSDTKIVRVNHQAYGVVRICHFCLQKEAENILPLPPGGRCGC